MSTHLMTHLRPQINFEKNYLLATKVIRKRHDIMLLIGLICLKILCSNITPSRQNKIYFWKLKTKLGMISVKRYRARERKKNLDRTRSQSDCRIRYRVL